MEIVYSDNILNSDALASIFLLKIENKYIQLATATICEAKDEKVDCLYGWIEIN